VSQLVTVGLMLVRSTSRCIWLDRAGVEAVDWTAPAPGWCCCSLVLVADHAWSEVSAMAVAAAVSLYLQLVLKWDSDRPAISPTS